MLRSGLKKYGKSRIHFFFFYFLTFFSYVQGNSIPLPARACHEIRKKFPIRKDESFTGFEMDEEDGRFE